MVSWHDSRREELPRETPDNTEELASTSAKTDAEMRPANPVWRPYRNLPDTHDKQTTARYIRRPTAHARQLE